MRAIAVTLGATRINTEAFVYKTFQFERELSKVWYFHGVSIVRLYAAQECRYVN